MNKSSPESPMSDKGPSIPLETEPLVFFHPLLVGTSKPGDNQPVPGMIKLEEEPATWPQLGA